MRQWRTKQNNGLIHIGGYGFFTSAYGFLSSLRTWFICLFILYTVPGRTLWKSESRMERGKHQQQRRSESDNSWERRREERREGSIDGNTITARKEDVRNPGMKTAFYATNKAVCKQSRMPDCVDWPRYDHMYSPNLLFEVEIIQALLREKKHVQSWVTGT